MKIKSVKAAVHCNTFHCKPVVLFYRAEKLVNVHFLAQLRIKSRFKAGAALKTDNRSDVGREVRKYLMTLELPFILRKAICRNAPSWRQFAMITCFNDAEEDTNIASLTNKMLSIATFDANLIDTLLHKYFKSRLSIWTNLQQSWKFYFCWIFKL